MNLRFYESQLPLQGAPLGEQKRQNLNQAVCSLQSSPEANNFIYLLPTNKNFWLLFKQVAELLFLAWSEPWHGLSMTANPHRSPCPSNSWLWAMVPRGRTCTSVGQPWATVFFYWSGTEWFMSSFHTGEPCKAPGTQTLSVLSIVSHILPSSEILSYLLQKTVSGYRLIGVI